MTLPTVSGRMAPVCSIKSFIALGVTAGYIISTYLRGIAAPDPRKNREKRERGVGGKCCGLSTGEKGLRELHPTARDASC